MSPLGFVFEQRLDCDGALMPRTLRLARIALGERSASRSAGVVSLGYCDSSRLSVGAGCACSPSQQWTTPEPPQSAHRANAEVIAQPVGH
jgi:hypothetical protein